MKINKNLANSLMAGALIGGSLVPVNVLANETHDRYQLEIENKREVDGELIPNAYYRTNMIKGLDEEGNETDDFDTWYKFKYMNNGKLTFQYQDGKNVPGIYEVQQHVRAPGYLLNDEKFQVEFPIMKDGVVSDDQTYKAEPKLELVESDHKLIKKDDKGGVLEGAKFELKKTHGPVLDYGETGDDDVDHPSIVFEKLKEGKIEISYHETNESGEIDFSGLKEGIYEIREVNAPKGYMVDTRPIKLTVTVDENNEVTTEFEGHSALTSEDEGLNMAMINYSAPSIDKKVDNVENVTVNYDEVFTYTIPIEYPGNVEEFEALSIHDMVDERLTVVEGSAMVVVGDVKAGEEHTDSGVTVNVEDKDGKTYLSADVLELAKANPESKLTLVFKATIDASKLAEDFDTEEVITVGNKAVLGFENNAGVKVEFNPDEPDKPTVTVPEDPNDPDPEDPEDPFDPPITEEVVVHSVTGKFDFKKVGEDKTIEQTLGNSGEKVELTYEDADGLEGVEFKLYEADKETVAKDVRGEELVAVSGEDGKVEFKGLKFADRENLENIEGRELTYYLKETKTAEGYRLNDKFHEVKVSISLDEDGKPVVNIDLPKVIDGKTKEFKNYLTTTGLPVTGVMTMLGGAAIVGGIAFVVLRDKKKKMNNNH